MMNRSMFLSAIVIAGLAMAAPANAGTVTVAGTYSTPGTTTTELVFNFTSAVSSVTATGTPTPTGTSIVNGGLTVDVFVPATESGSLTLKAVTSGTFTYGFVIPTGTASANNFNFKSVPEPASMALLGIGMTSFLAFRRFFNKRNPVA